jgi:hypothetical protein
MNRHRALACCLRMIFSENRCTFFRIMRQPAARENVSAKGPTDALFGQTD